MTITRNTRIDQLLIAINSLLRDNFTDIAVKDFGQLHDDIALLLVPVLEPLGLEYRVWTIQQIATAQNGYDSTDLLFLKVDFTEYKNSGWKRRGRLHSARFTTVEELKATATGEDTIESLLVNRKISIVDNEIAKGKEWIEKCKADQLKAESNLQTQLNKLRFLNSDLVYTQRLAEGVFADTTDEREALVREGY